MPPTAASPSASPVLYVSKKEAGIGILTTGIAYSDALSEQVVAMQQESDIVEAQQESDKNVMTMEEISQADKGFPARCSGR